SLRSHDLPRRWSDRERFAEPAPREPSVALTLRRAIRRWRWHRRKTAAPQESFPFHLKSPCNASISPGGARAGTTRTAEHSRGRGGRSGGSGMPRYDEPSAAHRPEDVADEVREDDLMRVMREV